MLLPWNSREQQGEIANRAKCRIEAHASVVTVIENTTGRRAPVRKISKCG